MLLAGVGVHPSDLTGPLGREDVARLERLAASSHRVVCVSEVGLDFGPGSPDAAVQFQAFREQVRLAKGLRLPIVFHSREAPGRPELHSEALRVLREERGWEVGGAMHYFQADAATARMCLDLGFLISLGKPLLRMPHLQAIVADLPLNAIVLETDSFPQPFKAKRENWTEPRDVRAIAHRVADLKGLELTEVEAATTANLVAMVRRAGAAGPGEAMARALGVG
jgi:TatD DNase family protein